MTLISASNVVKAAPFKLYRGIINKFDTKLNNELNRVAVKTLFSFLFGMRIEVVKYQAVKEKTREILRIFNDVTPER